MRFQIQNVMATGILLVLAFFSSHSLPNCFGQSTRPNIVLILTDDMGWADPGFHGGNAQLTPHMDQLAGQSMRMTQFYAHSVCAPTRAALMTGRYAFRTWMDWRSEDFGKPSYLAKLNLTLAKNSQGVPTRMIHALDTNELTIAEVLKEAGYFTAIIGKWHLGEWFEEHLPRGQGFLHQYGHYGWGIDYTNYTIPHNAPARFAVYDWHRNGQPLDEQGYATDLFANETVRLISQQTSDKPFFIYVPFNAIHGPLESIPRYREKFDKRQSALKCLDDAVGRIVGAIDQHGFKENTLLIFANDNGGLKPEHNKPYRGTKNTTYEGGVRVPCLMRWPGKLPARSTNDGMMHVVDLLPTLAKIAKAQPDYPRPIDGLDQTSMILKKEKSPRTEIVFEVAGSVRLPTIRSGKFKLVGNELYDLENDPSEAKNIAAKHPEIVGQLKARLNEMAKQRPPLQQVIGNPPRLMEIPLPYVYGEQQNRQPPPWLVRRVEAVRASQPKSWPAGKTPWPQAPKGGKIEYKGDGR